MDKLHQLSLRDAATRIREGELTAAELTRAYLTRGSRLEPRIEAWEHLAAEQAMERAEALDQARASGKATPPFPKGGGEAGGFDLPPLHGVPLGIKDIIDVAGMPTTMGSPIHAGRIARESAPLVRALEAAGAVILGKTVTTEFAYFTPNKTKNPWNPAHTPGGSSMGSAAAVAAGMVLGAIGTQTNGSVIRPAAFCGVVGWKPSLGSIPVDGMLAFAQTFDTVGVFTRSVADAAWLAAVLMHPGRRHSPEIAELPRPPRLAAVRSPVWANAEDAQKEMFLGKVDALHGAGATVSMADLPAAFDGAHEVHLRIMAFEAARSLGAVQREHRDRISARLNSLLDEGAAIPETGYRDALAARASLQQDYARFLADFDAVITPPTAGEAPATLTQTGSPAFCSIWTLLGVPALAIPVALGPRGMPLGLQVVGAAGQDDKLLSVAAWCERVLPFAGMPGEA